MGTVHQLPTPRSAGPTLGVAVAGFLSTLGTPNTAKAYGVALRGLVDRFGADRALPELSTEPAAEEIAAWFLGRWGTTAVATFNVRLDALRSAAAWWDRQGWLPGGDPFRRIRRRSGGGAAVRAIDRSVLAAFLARPDLPLRERLLYTLLYESAARTEEVLALDVPALDRPNRRARVRRKGGAADVITWQTRTARLLPRYLEGRTTGPLFLTHRRARVELPAGDLDPSTGRARLSYRRAEEQLSQLTTGEPGGPWDLHQLRHSALTHAAEDGASTAMLMALSGHTNVKSLAIYTKISTEALARWRAEHDPAGRRR
ncbi:tyrosine-type recombinase/integrase [Amycolatopsis sacchari]|uniref:tyrosine-type recombinase/integrase n=1 Tax=Amycolatopsis sacchari TaxID=115433 RepID=UPI003D724771